MFKEDTFSFTPIDELVLSMPFDFIRNLKVGVWTNIERNWLKRLHKHLAQAENNSIKQVKLIRKIVTDNRMKESREYEDDHEKYIFKILTAKGDSYVVNFAQIHDIIGDEPLIWQIVKSMMLMKSLTGNARLQIFIKIHP